MNGKRLIICNESPHNGKWFYVKDGIKWWITSIDALKDNGINIDVLDVEIVPTKEADTYKNGKFIIKNSNSFDEITNHHEARAHFLKNLKGYGIEFGAATSPTFIPDSCQVDYADFFQANEGSNDLEFNHDLRKDFVDVKYHTSLDEMKGIDSDSLDFIIHCHVIEHVPRTLLALKCCFDRLKIGGILFMAIPHMKYTLDCLRSLTILEHFVQDYNNYVKERDLLHLVDYAEHCAEYDAMQQGVKAERVTLLPVLENFEKGDKIDFHYHTFTEENFAELMDYFNNNISKWSKTEIIPRIPFEGSNEFYVRLIK